MDGEIGKGGTKIAIMKEGQRKRTETRDLFQDGRREKFYGPELKSPGRLITIGRFPYSHCWISPSLSLQFNKLPI